MNFKTDGFRQRLNEVVPVDLGLLPLAELVVVEGYTISFVRGGEDFVEEVHVTGVLLPDSA